MNLVNQPNQSGTEIIRLASRLNGRELPYYAIIPAESGAAANSSKQSRGVLYLLHGLFGRFDNWITNTDLLDYARDFSFVIVCAEAGDSWYTDNPEIENHFYESYLTEELIPDVEQRFKVRAERNSRAIAGLSMGGYGAFKLAFRQPELFCLAASMSGAFHAAGIFDRPVPQEWRELRPSIEKAFGSSGPQIRRDNDLFRLAGSFPTERIDALPYFYFDCGSGDSFLPVSLKLAKIFRKRGIRHQFRQFPGGHDWEYWNRQLRRILLLAEARLGA